MRKNLCQIIYLVSASLATIGMQASVSYSATPTAVRQEIPNSFEQGITLYLEEKYRESVESFEAHLKLHPNDLATKEWIGLVQLVTPSPKRTSKGTLQSFDKMISIYETQYKTLLQKNNALQIRIDQAEKLNQKSSRNLDLVQNKLIVLVESKKILLNKNLNLEKQLELSVNEFNKISNQLESSASEKDVQEFNQPNIGLESDILELKTNSQNLQALYNGPVQNEIQVTSEKFHQLESKLKSKQVALQRSLNQSKSLESKTTTLNERVRTLHLENNQLTQRLGDLQTKNDSLLNQVNKHETGNLGSSKQNVQKLRAQVNRLTRAYDDVRKKLYDQQYSNKDLIQKLENANESEILLQGDFSKIQSEYGAFKQNSLLWMKQFKKSLNNEEKLQAEIRSLQELVATLASKLSNSNIVDQNKQLEPKILELERGKTRLKEQINLLQTKLSASETQIDSMQNIIQNRDVDLKQKNDMLRKLKVTTDLNLKLTDDLKTMQNKLSQLSSQLALIEKNKNEIKQLQQSLIQATADIEQLKRDLFVKSEEVLQSDATSRTLKNELRKIQVENKNIAADLREKEVSLKAARIYLDDLNNSSSSQINRLQDQLKLSESSQKQLQAQYDTVQSKIQNQTISQTERLTSMANDQKATSQVLLKKIVQIRILRDNISRIQKELDLRFTTPKTNWNLVSSKNSADHTHLTAELSTLKQQLIELLNELESVTNGGL